MFWLNFFAFIALNPIHLKETKLEDNEKKSLTKDETSKGSPYKDRNPEEKEVRNWEAIGGCIDTQ